MKTGMGSYAIRLGDLKVGAVVALNALGDVYDWKNGRKIAGLLAPDRKSFRSTADVLNESIKVIKNRFADNTTLAVLITNAKFDKAALCKIAGMCHDGYARSIRPVHTSFDGDSIYAVSAGELEADQEVVGSIAADVISEAIIKAVMSAEDAYGLPSRSSLEL